MVPESIEFRRQLPRTSSGKVDRRALARPNAALTPDRRTEET
jgi:acyl-coenzyme A synthetase/AMP-(fatty) acid ligase